MLRVCYPSQQKLSLRDEKRSQICVNGSQNPRKYGAEFNFAKNVYVKECGLYLILLLLAIFRLTPALLRHPAA